MYYATWSKSATCIEVLRAMIFWMHGQLKSMALCVMVFDELHKQL